MDSVPSSSTDLFVPVLAWPGRRPTLAQLATWHEALRGAVGTAIGVDLFACWLYPARGGAVLVGPRDLSADDLEPPPAEPLVTQEALFALEDRIARAGYRSVMVLPIRAEMRDVGLVAAATFAENAYSLRSQRELHRINAQLATTFRRLGAQPWVMPRPIAEEGTALTASVAESLLDVIARARDGAELVQLASDALGNQLPHDRLEIIAAAPAPAYWALPSLDRAKGQPADLPLDAGDAIDALVHHFGPDDVVRVDDLWQHDLAWPAAIDRRGSERLRSVLAARMDVGGEFIGWLGVASEETGWFSADDEVTARLAARLLAPRIAAWAARAELAGAWA